MEEQKLNINLTPEMAEGTYANLAIIAHSNSEFVMDFVRMMPGQKNANVQSRVIMTPDNAKKLLFALQENIAKFEKQNGTIKINGTPAPGSTIPMSFGGGDA
jgi:ABC-type glycerol-3-phosphate transport system substrate-binding protein